MLAALGLDSTSCYWRVRAEVLLLWLFISRSRGLLTAHNLRNWSGGVKAMADGARRITYGMGISRHYLRRPHFALTAE